MSNLMQHLDFVGIYQDNPPVPTKENLPDYTLKLENIVECLMQADIRVNNVKYMFEAGDLNT